MAPPVPVVVNQATYGDLQAAAVSTLQALKAGAQDAEQAGLIVRDPSGQFHSTVPITSAQHDEFSLAYQPQKGWTVAGIYHTHPGVDSLAQYFSPGDVSMANQLKVPSYIRFLKDNSLRVYTPGVTRTERIGDPSSSDYYDGSYGDPVKVLAQALTQSK